MTTKKRPKSVAKPSVTLYQSGIAVKPGKGGAVIAGARGVGVENLRKAVRAGVRDRTGAEFGATTAIAVNTRIDEGEDEHGKHGHLHVVRLRFSCRGIPACGRPSSPR